MAKDLGIKANQNLLSWCKNNPRRIERAIMEHVKGFFNEGEPVLVCEDKFWVGFREHGPGFTDLSDKQLDKMIEEEIIDLRHYIGLKVSRRRVPPSAFKS